MYKISGIYKITNTINNKYYIGSSININYRLAEHKRRLKRGTHWNEHLQLSWNKYGERAFVFEIIEKSDSLTIREIEQKYLNKAKNDPLSFNMNFSSTCIHFTDEIKAKMKKSRIGKYVGDKNPAYKKIDNIIIEEAKIIWINSGKNVLIKHLKKTYGIGGTVAARFIKEFRKDKEADQKRKYNQLERSKQLFNNNNIGVKTGGDNVRFNHTIYNLKNIITGEIFQGKVSEFFKKYGFYLKTGFLKNKRKSCLGWTKILPESNFLDQSERNSGHPNPQALNI